MSKTPRTEAACFSATTERPTSGDFELCVVYADFARELERELTELREWKESMLTVERQWDCQNVAKLLGIPLGSDIRSNIEPKIQALCEDKSLLDAFDLAGRKDDVQAHQISEDECEQELIGHFWETPTVQSASCRDAIRAAIGTVVDEEKKAEL